MKKIIIALFTGILLFTLTGCNEQKKENYKIGDTITIDGLEIEVTDKKELEGKNYYRPKDGYIYQMITIKLTNKTNHSISYDPANFKILSKENIEPSLPVIGEKPYLQTGKLEKEKTITGNIVFEIPKESQNLKLGYFKNTKDKEPKITISL